MGVFVPCGQALADDPVWPSLTVSELGGNCIELREVSTVAHTSCTYNRHVSVDVC